MNTVSLLIAIIALSYLLANGIARLIGPEDTEPWVEPDRHRDDREMWER